MPSAYSVPMASDVLARPRTTPTTATVPPQRHVDVDVLQVVCAGPRAPPMTAGRVPGTARSPVATQRKIRQRGAGFSLSEGDGVKMRESDEAGQRGR